MEFYITLRSNFSGKIQVTDLFKRFSKHPQLLSVGFYKCDWQLLELEEFWVKIRNFLPEFEK